MSPLQVLISEQDVNAADPVFNVQLMQSERLLNDDNSEFNGSPSTNMHHPVQRSLSQLNGMHQQYTAINTTCILPAFPSNVNNVKNRLDRYYKKLFTWAPEIENWAGLHEFFSDRTPLIKGATKAPGIFKLMIESLIHRRGKNVPALPAHYSSKEQVELKHDTLAVYKRIIQYECDMKQLQNVLTSELVVLCQQGKLVEELGDKLEDLATIKVCNTGSFGSKGKSNASFGDDVHAGHEEMFSEEVALRTHSTFEVFCNKTVQALGQIELTEQSFIKHVSEQVIEPIRDHLHDFGNAKLFLDKRTAALMSVDKVGDVKRAADARVRQLEMSGAQGNAGTINEAVRVLETETQTHNQAVNHFHAVDALVHDQLVLFLERSKAIVNELLTVYEGSKGEMREAVRTRLSQSL